MKVQASFWNPFLCGHNDADILEKFFPASWFPVVGANTLQFIKTLLLPNSLLSLTFHTSYKLWLFVQFSIANVDSAFDLDYQVNSISGSIRILKEFLLLYVSYWGVPIHLCLRSCFLHHSFLISPSQGVSHGPTLLAFGTHAATTTNYTPFTRKLVVLSVWWKELPWLWFESRFEGGRKWSDEGSRQTQAGSLAGPVRIHFWQKVAFPPLYAK